MSVYLIPFLTHNDKTVDNALEVFKESKDAPTDYWGFKDTGIEEKKVKELLKAMKETGKTTFYESLAEVEKEALETAKFALELEFEYLIGMQYFESVHRLLKDKNIKFVPTCGERSGIPRMLHGSIDDVINDGKRIQNKGVDGLCLSAYRFTGGDPEALAERFINELDVPVIVTGSINSEHRLDVMKKLRPWAFTIGSAFFNNDFGKDLSFAEQIEKVVNHLMSY